MKKILFVHTPCPQIEDDCLEPPLGLLILGAYIRKNGHHVRILDLSGNKIKDCISKLKKECSSFNFDYVCFSTYTSTFHITKKVSNEIKKICPSIKTVAGGPHASALFEEVSEYFDHTIVGEGEEGLLRLLNGDNTKIIISKHVENLDDLPLPAYDLIDIDMYTRKVNGEKSFSILTTRGCPYNCYFCNSTVFSKNEFRKRSPESVASEINLLYDKYGVSQFRFQDDLFAIDEKRIEDIFNLCPKIEYRCFVRADCLTKSMCDTLKKTGCLHVSIGVESGSNTILTKMNKGLTKEKIKEGIINAHKAGLIIRIYLIVGFPGESEETINETINLLDNLPFDEFVVYPLIPYPGTKIFDEPDKFGIKHIDKDYSKYIQVGINRFTGFVFETEDIKIKKLKEWRKKIITHLEEKCNKSWSSTKSKFR